MQLIIKLIVQLLHAFGIQSLKWAGFFFQIPNYSAKFNFEAMGHMKMAMRRKVMAFEKLDCKYWKMWNEIYCFLRFAWRKFETNNGLIKNESNQLMNRGTKVKKNIAMHGHGHGHGHTKRISFGLPLVFHSFHCWT